MTTTVTHSIGATGRDYSSIAAWFAAIPSDLTAVDQIWIGECYNDAQLTCFNLVLSGITTDSTRYIVLRAASGQGFNTATNRLTTNKLRYDPSNGVSMECSSSYNPAFTIQQTNILIQGMQFAQTVPQNLHYGMVTVFVTSSVTFDSCIMHYDYPASSQPTFYNNSPNTKLINCLLTTTSQHTGPGYHNTYSPVYQFCTLALMDPTAAVGDSRHQVIINVYTGTIMTNGFVMGRASTMVNDAENSANDYNATDLTYTYQAPGVYGSHTLVNLTVANEFNSVTNDSTFDLRLKSTSTVKAAGTPISGITTDILGQTRSSTTPSIGAFEYVSTAIARRALYLMSPSTPAA